MNKLLRFSFVALLAMIGLNLSAADVTDELTWDKLLEAGKGNGYQEFSGMTVTSNAVYAGIASSGADTFIQLRTKSNNEGIVTTTSGGKLKSVTITFNEKTTDRSIEIYGSNTAYTAATDLYGDNAGTKLGTIASGDSSLTLTVDGNYTFVGLRSSNGALYIDKITIVWDGDASVPETKTATSIVFADGFETRATCGKDEFVKLPFATVMAGDVAVEGATVTWSLSSDSLAQLDGDALKIFNGVQGTVDVIAEYAGDSNFLPSSKSYTLTVYKGYLQLKSLVDDVTSSNPKWDNGGEYASYWFINEELRPVTNTVTFASGKYIYLTNGTDNMLLYGNNSLGLQQGHVISGALDNGQLGAVWGKLYRYNGLPELAFTDMDVQIQDSVTVVPKTITVDQLGENVNGYVTIENAQFVSAEKKNLTFNVGETELPVYNQFNIPVETLVEGATYTLTGMGSVYKTANQLYLVGFSENTIIEPQPGEDSCFVATIADLEALCYAGDSTQCMFTFNDLLVAYKGANHTYVTDGNRGMLLFGESGLNTGDRISGTVTGVPTLYFGTPELKIELSGVNVSVLSYGNEVPRKPVTAAELNENPSQWMNQYVVIDNVTFDSLYTTDDYFRTLAFHSDNVTFTLFNLFNRRWTIDPTAVYTMEGVVDVNEGNIRIAPLAYTDLTKKMVLPENVGTLERPFTVAEAAAFASSLEVGQQTDQAYYVKGNITTINYTFDENYGNATFWISDTDTTGVQFLVYRTLYLENTLWKEGFTQIKEGDEVIIYGQLTNYKGTPETVSRQSYIYSLNGNTVCEIIEEPVVEPIEGISYSWESPDGNPLQWGGSIAYVNGDGDRLNYTNSGYYTICLNGKKANINDEVASANAGKMVITLDKPLNAGDTIAYTAFINKNQSKEASPYILFENGTAVEGEIFGDEANLDSLFNGVPTTKYTIVPAEAGGSKTITLTRSKTGTNLFITKFQIIEYVSGETPIDVENGIWMPAPGMASEQMIGDVMELNAYNDITVTEHSYQDNDGYWIPSPVEYDGYTFEHWLNICVAVNPTAENILGDPYEGSTSLVIYAKKDIALTAYYRRQATRTYDADSVVTYSYQCNDGKDIHLSIATDPEAFLSAASYHYSPIGDGYYAYADKTWQLKAGRVYTLFARGTTGRLMGLKYTEDEAVVEEHEEWVQVFDANVAGVLNGVDGRYYKVTGVCTSISNTAYGNWMLQDATGELYIYGTLDADGNRKNFESLGIQEGDTVTVVGPKKTYNGIAELINVTVVKIVHPVTEPEFANGDVNHDGAIDVTDAVLIIDEILMKNPANFDALLADVNSDGEIDVTDVVMVIDVILGKIQLARDVEATQKDLSAYTAFQMDLTIPAGYVLEGVDLTEMAKDSHSLAYNMLSDGRCRVVVFSMDNEALHGAWDEVIRLNLRGQGDAFVNVDRAMFVTVGGERHELLINGTTSIAQFSTLNSQFSIVYDLTGRKVQKTAKGVYIENGRKVVK